MNFTGELKDAITKRAVFLLLGVLGLQVLFIISYVGALHSPSPSRVPFDLVAPAPAAVGERHGHGGRGTQRRAQPRRVRLARRQLGYRRPA